MNGFEHESLDVYRVSVEFLARADEVAASLPKGRAHLVDQLRRASTSISLNIAEGAGEFSKADKARFYRIARRSSTECSAILDESEAARRRGAPRTIGDDNVGACVGLGSSVDDGTCWVRSSPPPTPPAPHQAGRCRKPGHR